MESLCCCKKQTVQEDIGVDQQHPAAEMPEIPQSSSRDVELPTITIQPTTQTMPSTSCGSTTESSSRDVELPTITVQPTTQTMPSTSRGSTTVPKQILGADRLRAFALDELKVATANFLLFSKLGHGRFGDVFRGRVKDLNNPDALIEVAVKRMSTIGYKKYKRDLQFLAEVKFLNQLSHDNIVELIGYSQEDMHHLLVYKYMSNRSLNVHLYTSDTHDMQSFIDDDFSNKHKTLPWDTRVKIALGTADGLNYLHTRQPPIIFGDFKSSDILLDENYNPKLSDFGHATESPTDRVHTSKLDELGGSDGYAPRENGKLTVKSDVYSFGVVLLELLTGRRAFYIDMKQALQDWIINWNTGMPEQSLVNWAKPQLKFIRNKKINVNKIIDSKLKGRYKTESAHVFAMLAASCIEKAEDKRPDMGQVVQTLSTLPRAVP